MNVTWRDPAAILALLIWVGLFALLATGRTVPDQVWVAGGIVTGFFYSAHQGATTATQATNATQSTTAQFLTALNGSAGHALSGAAAPATVEVAPASSAARPYVPPAAGGAA